MMGRYFLFSIGLLSCFFVPTRAYACTLAVANGHVTTDGRPLLWRNGDSTINDRTRLVWVSAQPYNYLGTSGEGGGVYNGFNEAGVVLSNSSVDTPPGPSPGASPYNYILQNCNSVDQIRDFLIQYVDDGECYLSGCFPFIDRHGNATVFEINRSNWILEYNAMDPDREGQGLLGFVVRANEFHQRTDGTDDTNIGGRYKSGTYNISGLVGIDMLCAKTIIQGNDKPNSGFEVARYGPGRPLTTISRSITRTAWVVHGVLPNEDPALTTAWVILGQSNYGIAVPAWVRVSDIPQCLSSYDMYDRAKSLYDKGNEAITQASIFPAEAHMFDVVVNTFLPHWRAEGSPSVAEMTRIEDQMAGDAYSLLDCLDNRQSDNKAPNISFHAHPNDLTIDFELIANDSDGTINNIEWNFGDDMNSTEQNPSHTYTQPGTYLVSCTVTDDDGVSITNWKYYVVPVSGDITGDGKVDFYDLAVFVDQWLLEKLSYDVAPGGGDGIVNFLDWAVFTNSWQGNMNEVADFAYQWLKLSAYCTDIAPAPGGDGVVNFIDFAVFATHWLEGQ